MPAIQKEKSWVISDIVLDPDLLLIINMALVRDWSHAEPNAFKDFSDFTRFLVAID